ncbi:hypothetical protein QBZ16_004223 [Prototheca wickerhamii]|uniref:Phospholipase/carboxylesterase/thioesterase domain-containing protein n=1 Tax=Prototheca wickerhamii TaxID=3111 RepID=A0AAD9IFQ8_PROWI|nr:hypothetical protein QBZ16_004223 [Prototheca wickerhamii]
MIYPTATTRPITVDLGQGVGGPLPGWFDIDGIGEPRFRAAMEGQLFDPEGVAQSLQRIQELIDAEVASGTPKERIVLGGFSQAGHLALLAHLAQGDQPLAGCVALCTWIQPEAVSEALKSKPVFACHGTGDTIIPYEIGVESMDSLLAAGIKDVEFKTYPGLDHVQSPQMVEDVKSFLLRVLP